MIKSLKIHQAPFPFLCLSHIKLWLWPLPIFLTFRLPVSPQMAAQGDGYEGTEDRSSPHTDYEKFEGLTVMRAARVSSSH